jgi:hypothetical protein
MNVSYLCVDSSSDEFGLEDSDSEEHSAEDQAEVDEDTDEEELAPMVNGDDRMSSEGEDAHSGDEEMELSS